MSLERNSNTCSEVLTGGNCPPWGNPKLRNCPNYCNIKKIEADIVAEAKAYTGKTNDSEIRDDLQHYGGKTNLIDFTTDYNVALFFACYGSPTEFGQVIILRKTEKIKEMLRYPKTPEIRVGAQKSVFVEPTKGYIEEKFEVIYISKELKLLTLQHLKENLNPEITPKTIYNDIHGFIRSHNNNWMAYRDFYNGLTARTRAHEAKTLNEKQRACKKAIDYYTNALDRNLQLAPVYNNRGNTYLSKGEYEHAITDYNSAIQLEPDYAKPYYGRGYAYLDKDNYNSAIKDYTKAVELKPDYAEAYNNRGGAYGKKGEHDLAIADFNTALELKHDYPEAYNNRGNAYCNKGDVEQAIEDFTKAIELKPDYPEAYNNRGNAYVKKDEFELAIKDCNKAIQLNCNYAEAYNNRGTAYGKKAQYDQAIVDLNRAIEIKSDYAAAYNNRGVTYHNKGEFDRAIENYNKTLEFEPDYTEAYNNRRTAYSGKRMAYYEKNKSEFGIDYTEAIQRNPGDPSAYYNRGEVFLRLKLWDKARSDLMIAKNMGADVASLFHNFYANVADFEQEWKVKLPEDIAAMLTPP